MKNLSFLLFISIFLISCEKDNSGPTVPDINLVEPPTAAKHMVLIEPIVSVGCGACPLAHHQINDIESDNEDITHISHYLFGPLHHPYSKHLWEKINKTFFTPLGHIDRRHEEGSIVYFPVDMLQGIITKEQSENTTLSFQSDVAVEDNFFNVAIALFTQDEADMDAVRITVVLVEKSVVGVGSGYDQRNYGNDDPEHPYYQQGEWIEGFEHTNVIRQVLTSFDGDMVNLASGEASWSGELALDSLSKPASAYHLVAFVSKKGQEVMPIINSAIIELPAN